MKSTASIAIFHTFLLLVASLAACSTVSTETAQTDSTAGGDEVGEIMPGLLEGYIPQDEQLDSMVFVRSSAQQAPPLLQNFT